MNPDLKYYLIFNPAANHGRAARLIPQIEEFFNDWKLNYTLAVTKAPKEATNLAREAAKKYEVVVAIGGDGTINEVVNGLVGSKATMGIVPVGAGNDFSKALGLKHRLREDLETLLKNKIRKVDVGKVNGLYFINLLGVGFDALVAEKMFKRPKFLKGLPVYLYSLGRALKNYAFTHLKVTADNFREEKDFLMVAAANGQFFGGGFHITPHASISDGFFDIFLASTMKRSYLIKNIPKVIKGTHESLPEVKIIRAKKVIIEGKEELPVEYDGELLTGQKKMEIEIVPQALSIIGN